MIRLLLDENLPRSAVSAIRAAGWECTHVLDQGLGGTPDADILAWAGAEGWVLVTEDADFTALLALGNLASPAVVFLRVAGLNRHTLPRLLADRLPTFEGALVQGAIASVEPHGVRVRTLPVLPP